MCHLKGYDFDFKRTFYLERKVDFLSEFGEKTYNLLIVSKILSYFSGSELMNVAKVSKTWNRLCREDRAASSKMKQHMAKKRMLQENPAILNRMQHHNESTPKKRRPFSCWFENINVSKAKETPASPPVSPRQRKFNKYVKEGMKLGKEGKLTPCPRCSLPSIVKDEEGSGICTHSFCSFHFCLRCRCAYHPQTTCKYFITSSPSSSPKSKSGHVICSKQSRKALRRL